jgi:hypothetical protein
VTVLLIILLAASGAPAQTVQGDPKATQEVEAAWERLWNLKTYRMRTTMMFEKPAQSQPQSQSDGAGLAPASSPTSSPGTGWGCFSRWCPSLDPVKSNSNNRKSRMRRLP